MGKIKKFASIQIKKITGGKDPTRLVEDFIMRRGFDPEQCVKEKTSENIRWMIPIAEEEELEILVESLTKPAETTNDLPMGDDSPMTHAEKRPRKPATGAQPSGNYK
jgi:hypothetical protein